MKESLPGLYVHIPFCKSRCRYCDFYSITDTSLIGRYIDAISAEAGTLAAWRERTAGRGDDRLKEGPPLFDTLYLGGGSPSFLGPDGVSRLMDGLRSGVSFSEEAEMTIELNPDDITGELLAACMKNGINRASLGVQSFDPAELAFLGRRHDADQARSAIAGIREAGFKSTGLDLIFGFHGQTLDSWLSSLEEAASFMPEHLSCYQMTIENGTEMGRLKAEGKISEPGGDRQSEFYMTTSRYLAAQGYIHYEISNYAKDEGSVSRHNSRYWDHTPYAGLGPSAHSFDGRKRWWNVSSVRSYCERIESGLPAVEDSETLSDDQLLLEKLYFGFRTRKGLSTSFLTGLVDGEVTLSGLVDGGFVKIREGIAVPTLKGFLFADSLPAMFL